MSPKQLAKPAQAAARDGDCTTVRALEGTLDDANPALHDEVYFHDPNVLRCMH